MSQKIKSQKWLWIIGGIFVLIIIIIIASRGEKTLRQAQISQPFRQETQKEEEKLEPKKEQKPPEQFSPPVDEKTQPPTKEEKNVVDFQITAEEIYSNYIKCQKDFSIENSIRKKYDGKIVEVTGIVEKEEEIDDRFLAFFQQDEGRRYHICLADNQGHACVVWAYSSFPQLIEKIKKGDKITVTGQWQYVGSTCGIPDLMNSEIKKIY